MPIGEDEASGSLDDFIQDQDSVLPLDSAMGPNFAATTGMLAWLTPREERVLRMRFGIRMDSSHTLEEIGHQFSATLERIRQIEAKALRKLIHSRRAPAARLPRGLHISRWAPVYRWVAQECRDANETELSLRARRAGPRKTG
jgi:DNA-directed RNA polymerase sigma subunit (sigma70/sigma32)